jgi:UDP-N-acetylmuramate dehydrogenase
MNALAAELRGILQGPVLVGELLGRHTTWRIGGPAELFVAPRSEQELLAVLHLLAQVGMPWMALGTGSNLLVRDGGYRGAIIHMGALQTMEFRDDGTARVGGGLPVMRLVRQAVRRGLAGLEDLAGIPATVGGAVVMNAGAGEQAMAGVLQGAFLAGAEGMEYWPAARLDLRYRASAVPADRIVAAAILRFSFADAEMLESNVQHRLSARRKAQGVGKPNAGSVFKNPPGQQAWRLIDESGMRGRSVGGAQVSEKHANFIVNRGGARAADVLSLIGEIQETVRGRTGIMLEPEVQVIGEA